jgi:hypothetical protein
MMGFLRLLNNGALELPLFVLKILVYSKSSLITMIFLSLYGLTHGVARVPRNRLSAVKSLLHYGVDVLQRGLGTSIQSAKS